MKIPNKKIIIGGVAAIILIIGAVLYFVLAQNKLPAPFSVQVKTGDITEKINLTGQVKASQGVDMAFEMQGKITANYAKAGDKIYAGEPLVAIDSSLLQAQLNAAQAQLGTLDINTINDKNNAALQALYATSLSAAQKSAGIAKDILLTITDIQYAHFTDTSSENINLASAKAQAVYSLLGQPNAGMWTSDGISQLGGGAFGLIENATNNPTQDNVDSALLATKIALQNVSNMVNAVPIDLVLTSTERASISLAKTNINLEIITTSANIQAIATQKVNNSAGVTSTNLQIVAGQAGIDAIKTQISKTVLTALFNGRVDKDSAVVGSIVSPNTPIITISNNNLEIDTSIPEIDIAQAKIGDLADVTLDAYGDSVVFPASVVSIDTAQSVATGVSVYNAKLKFTNFDSRIKPGMTANINIISDTHKDALIIPSSAVIQKNGNYFVIADKGNNQKEARQITIGLRDGKNVEVLSGLSVNEKVFAY